jgi:hypothetical protein
MRYVVCSNSGIPFVVVLPRRAHGPGCLLFMRGLLPSWRRDVRTMRLKAEYHVLYLLHAHYHHHIELNFQSKFALRLTCIDSCWFVSVRVGSCRVLQSARHSYLQQTIRYASTASTPRPPYPRDYSVYTQPRARSNGPLYLYTRLLCTFWPPTFTLEHGFSHATCLLRLEALGRPIATARLNRSRCPPFTPPARASQTHRAWLNDLSPKDNERQLQHGLDTCHLPISSSPERPQSPPSSRPLRP